MGMVIAIKTVRDQRRALLWWVLGIAAYTILLALFFPAIRNNSAVEDFVKAMPPDFMAFFGGTSISLITTPAGYLNAELFSFMLPVMFFVFTVTLGSGLIAGEEERGRLEILVTEPVSRRRVYLEQAVAIAVATTALTAVLWTALAAGALVTDMGISLANLGAASLSLWLLASAIGFLAMAVGGLTGKRSLAVGVAAGVAVLMYFINALGGIVSSIEPLRAVSLFYYYSEHFPLANGLDFVNATVPLVVSLVLTGIGAAGFERRDLRV